MDQRTSPRITDLSELEALYGAVARPSIAKVVDHIHPVYRPFIEAAPFAMIATVGENGLDISPRGDPAGFVHIENSRTLLLPDRRGNNRIDSLRNVLNDSRVGLLFLVPGLGETLRVIGHAEITVASDLLARFAVAGQPPRSILRIHVKSVYFQCSRAILRSGLWDGSRHVDRSSLPTPGTILETLTDAEIDGNAYDRALPDRLNTTLY